jgi:hypothetical protein
MRAVSKVGFADRTILRDTFLLTLAKTQDEKKAATGPRHLVDRSQPGLDRAAAVRA